MTPDEHDAPPLLEARHNERIARVFRWMVRRMVRKHFHSVAISRDSAPAFESMRRTDRPLIVLMNHQSWWDPLLGLLLADRYCHGRPGLAPMDIEMLRRFAIFRRVGMFGIDPDDPRSIEVMRTYAGSYMRTHEGSTLWLTPQGRFADPRAPIRLRPGVSAVASSVPGCRVISIATEYVHWLDKRPEALLHASQVEAPENASLSGWHRACTRAMQRDNRALSALVIGRNPERFLPLFSEGSSGTSPFYNLWLRLRGRRTDLASARTTAAKAPPEPATSEGRPA